MIVDFHTHVFPDKLAPNALSELMANINNIYKPVTDMTVAGLTRNMDNWNINYSIVQPVVTKPSQTLSINN